MSGISIHAPREGGDTIQTTKANVLCLFQSTPPARGATDGATQAAQFIGISIHAPREGGDSELGGGDCHMGISIHAPREGGDTAVDMAP